MQWIWQQLHASMSYNPRGASISLVDNRRFTMRDIGDIESRVSNLEETTTLSLLEVHSEIYKYKMKRVETDLKLDFL